ncbi:MAG: holo-ACP synthase [Lactobacillales bacterium]|jgi:holo-[acyl-carrier protein] synthase|nr:holo-ACP synthase [Lactobacillales bacterium]
MIKGIGCDIVEIKRVEKIIASGSGLVEKFLSGIELERFNDMSENRQKEYLAGRLAAKEAYYKAKGTGICSLEDFGKVEICSLLGRPTLQCEGEVDRVHVSISHDNENAIAYVIIESVEEA